MRTAPWWTPFLLAVTSPAQSRPTATDDAVTFHRDIAPIVYAKCASCHRAGEVGPFPLLTYADCRKRARMMLQASRSGYMPPWHPVEGHGSFVGETRMSAQDVDAIERWIQGGRLEGDPADAPPAPTFTEGWQLGEPDLVVTMPEGFTVPADGPDIYRNFVVPLELEQDRWLTAVEVRPGARSVLHHVIFGFDTTGSARRQDGQDGQPGFVGMRGQGVGESTSGLGGWAVGGQPQHLPMGLARRVPAGADLILRSHLHPSGKQEIEKTTLGLYFSKVPPTRSMVGLQLPPQFSVAKGIDIPPGEANYELEDSFELPVDCLAVSIGGHAHMVCEEMQVFATRPGAERESIFWIDDWDFDWQNRYLYREPVELPAGTRIDARIRYDNSADNADNPFDPPRRVRWGFQSKDEMGSVTLLLVAADEDDFATLDRAIRNKNRSAFRGDGGRAAMAASLISRLEMMDRNGNGRIEKDEVSGRMARQFDRVDRNGDGAIDAEELEALDRFMRGGRR